MKIFRSVKTNWLTQGFDENLVDIYKKWGMLGHNGYDWFERKGKGIYWDVDIRGVVKGVEIDSTGGIGVDIVTESIEGNYLHRFWHMLPNVQVKAGDILETGDLIAYCDTTGTATGPHLHRGFKRVEKDSFGNWLTQNKDNGYFGGIKIPEEWFENRFVLNVMRDKRKIIGWLMLIERSLRQVLRIKKQLKSIYD